MRQIIPDAIAQSAISKVVYIRRRMNEDINEIALNKKARPVETLLVYSKEYLDKECIRLIELHSNSNNHHVKSFYIHHKSSIDIAYLKDLNNCWRRFAVCKELWHILLADPSNYSPNYAEHIEGCFGVSLKDGEMASTYVERAAELAAMEYLLPYSERIEYTGKADLDYMKIADNYKIPRIYVEKFLNPHTIEQLGRLRYECAD
jgi:hypothetical protein